MLSCVRRLAPLLVLTSITFAEMPRPIELPPIPRLPSLTAKAGYIFSGTVKSVQPLAPHSTNSMPVMRITFQVEHGFSGVKSGQLLVIHECMGVWQAGDRYRPGQRVMLFL